MDDRQAVLQGMLRWRLDPVAFVREAIGAEPDGWQAEALTAIALNDRVAIRSGHGVGKSTLLAWVILWFLLTRFPAKVPCTAAKAHQLEDVLWAELAKWLRLMRPELAGAFELKSDRLELREAPKSNFAVARTARKENPEAFQGFHEDNLLFIADEASGVEDVIFEVGEGAMSTVGAKTVLTGNPTKTSGYFYDCFHKMRRFWHCVHVPCAKSSRATVKYAEEMAARYGIESNIYKVRVLGDFPDSEDSAVVPLHLVEAAVGRDVESYVGHDVVWGLDVARFGDDSSALAKRRGNILLEPIKGWKGKDLMQLSGIVAAEYHAEKLKPAHICVDIIGLGAGVYDRLRELGLPVRGVTVSESPAIQGKFIRLRDELWWRVREWFDQRDCRIPDDEEFIGEITGPSYTFTSGGLLKVESKEDMKKRHVPSPDKADAFCLTFAMGSTVKASYKKPFKQDFKWVV